jgi:ABC-2 type transport system ATP-binding protein
MPVLTATGAGVRHRRRWLFRDLDVTAEAGDLVAVVGVPGSGRTTVMLALARRFRLSAGKVDVFGTAALGYVPDVEQPEPVLSVAEHVRERLALLGRPSRAAAAVLGDGLYGLDPALKGRQLTPYQKQVLGLALARLENPAVIALDGVDDGLDAGEQAELWRILDELAATGVAVVVTAREIDPNRVATVIRLADPQAPELATSDAPVSDLAVSGSASSEPELAEAELAANEMRMKPGPAALDEQPTEAGSVAEAMSATREEPVADEMPRGAPEGAEAEMTTDVVGAEPGSSAAGAGDGETR